MDSLYQKSLEFLQGLPRRNSVTLKPTSTKISQIWWIGEAEDITQTEDAPIPAMGVVIAEFARTGALYLYDAVPFEVMNQLLAKAEDPEFSIGREFLVVERTYAYTVIDADQFLALNSIAPLEE